MNYPNVNLYINGVWRDSSSGLRENVINPATQEKIGTFAHASISDIEDAISASKTGLAAWQAFSVLERSQIMRSAAKLMRERVEKIATLLTMEEGKPLTEAKMEVNSAADLVDWFAEEARRTYGRIIPARTTGVEQHALRFPVGPAIGFTPWNFPVSQVLRKVGPALAAGCSIIIKGPEESPASPAEIFRCFEDAGVPAGTLGLLYGTPAEISELCIPHPTIRKVSFTGSVPVGKHLAALAAKYMKRSTMELGGHAAVIITEDADIESASKLLVNFKFRNAGQVCISPTRFIIHQNVFDRFVSIFTEMASMLRIGNGLESPTQMGPLINAKRLEQVEHLVKDATEKGAECLCGGKRMPGPGFFFGPTVLRNLTADMAIMNEEPFGPVALMISYDTLEEAIKEANRLPFALSAYAWTRNQRTADELSRNLETGMLTINHLGLALPETPYGGIKESGYGSEGGIEALDGYMYTKFVSRLNQ